MPMRWDEKARMTLLLKLIEQNPSILSKYSAETIASSWPGPEKPTGRAIIEQVKSIKKQVGHGNAKESPASKRSAAHSTPATPRTPKISTSTPSKRPNNSAQKSGSSTKRRRANPTTSDSESELPVLSSSQEDGDIEETDDEALNNTPYSTTKRRLPTRSKSRSKSYATEVDSAGEDAGAKELDSNEDEEFSLEAEANARSKAKSTLSAIPKTKQLDSSLNGEEGSEDVGLEDECDRDSENESRNTKTTFYSALEEI